MGSSYVKELTSEICPLMVLRPGDEGATGCGLENPENDDKGLPLATAVANLHSCFLSLSIANFT